MTHKPPTYSTSSEFQKAGFCCIIREWLYCFDWRTKAPWYSKGHLMRISAMSAAPAEGQHSMPRDGTKHVNRLTLALSSKHSCGFTELLTQIWMFVLSKQQMLDNKSFLIFFFPFLSALDYHKRMYRAPNSHIIITNR